MEDFSSEEEEEAEDIKVLGPRIIKIRFTARMARKGNDTKRMNMIERSGTGI